MQIYEYILSEWSFLSDSFALLVFCTAQDLPLFALHSAITSGISGKSSDSDKLGINSRGAFPFALSKFEGFQLSRIASGTSS
jgi:hypothetical protein